MLATATEFMFIYVVALANLCLGVATAVYLGRAPRLWPFVLRIPLAPGSESIPPAPTAAEPEPSPEASEPLSAEESEPLPEPPPEPEPEPMMPEVVDHINGQLKKASGSFQDVDEKLATSEEAPTEQELDEATSEVDGIAQALLKQINTGVDQIRRLNVDDQTPEEKREAVLEELDAIWNRFNDLAVQLVTISFGGGLMGEISGALSKACQEMRQACEQSRESLTSRLEESPSEETTSDHTETVF
jgi:hypothetical protein